MIAKRRVRPLAVLLFFVLALSVSAGALLLRAHSDDNPSSARIDSRLILQPRTIAVGGRLSNNLPFRLTIYPALPGSNSVRLTLPRASHPSAPMTVVATMIGMVMAPSRTTLVGHGQVFTGSIDLTMFGRYRLTVTEAGALDRQTDPVTVVLPLP
jgi:hypothetical protein